MRVANQVILPTTIYIYKIGDIAVNSTVVARNRLLCIYETLAESEGAIVQWTMN